ncbi:ATP-binding protein [Faecalibacillus intestinalis]|uniref:ATP-binding protein n=1 Tax=Faecalibacillus intestinalis TaxID=1982626 RepID=UPI0035204EA9
MIIERKEYLNKLITWKDKQLIKIVTGVRRCGKSVLLKMYQDYLKNNGVKESQIVTINFEDLDYEELANYKKLYNYLKEKLIPNKMTYIFLDESQNVDQFPKVLDSLYIKDNVDIYVTGSNAYMLSSEIATMISRRYIQIEMLPLSFKEYMESTGNMNDRGIKYTEYLQNSSFPYALQLKNQLDEIRDYLEGIYNTIVVKDIVHRKNITDTMTSLGRKINSRTVKKYLKSLEKYYIVDIGMRYILLGSKMMDTGHILENVVYLELLRRGYDVYVGKIDNYEVDFVAQNHKGTIYYQVALTVRDEKTLQRELRPLQAIRDHYPKVILTMDEDPKI